MPDILPLIICDCGHESYIHEGDGCMVSGCPCKKSNRTVVDGGVRA